MTTTFPVEEGARRLRVSTGWYLTQLRARKLPGHKIANRWCLTEDDITKALEITASPALVAAPDADGLTKGSRRRLQAASLPGTTRYRPA